jgi:hypothetical protein
MDVKSTFLHDEVKEGIHGVNRKLWGTW